MNSALKDLLKRAEAWPETAQAELVEIASEIEGEIAGDYYATDEELRALDEGWASVQRGEIASEAAVEAVFAKYRRL
jgi:hypothetical protein